ncbi:MAG: hypothetical protein IBX63_10500 [Coriobacteriia bacterium]|nr:hypothetical protein [Coriobacteriia bacterium]
MKIDDSSIINPVFPICPTCKHLWPTSEPLACEAFPDGIPDDILMGFDHRKPYEGDGGVRYEPRE